jgi:hypothetical protein
MWELGALIALVDRCVMLYPSLCHGRCILQYALSSSALWSRILIILSYIACQLHQLKMKEACGARR